MKALTFRPVELSDGPRIRALLAEEPPVVADLSFAYEYAHAHTPFVRAAFAETSGCGFYRWQEKGGTCFSYPFGGGDRRAALADLVGHCRAEAMPLTILDVPRAVVDALPGLLSDGFAVEPDRDEADYVYRASDLAELPGRLRQVRRRLIRRFEEAGAWSYAPIAAADDVADCRDILRDWMAAHPDGTPHQQDDCAALAATLDAYFELDLTGGVLRQNGRPVAFACGERLSPDTMLVSFERARPFVRGANAMINREFARHNCVGCTWINRTCDGGDAGLRQVKLEYGPARLVEKFLVRVPSVTST